MCVLDHADDDHEDEFISLGSQEFGSSFVFGPRVGIVVGGEQTWGWMHNLGSPGVQIHRDPSTGSKDFQKRDLLRLRLIHHLNAVRYQPLCLVNFIFPCSIPG